MESVVAEKVEGNYDVLVSTLVRLPPKSVFRFRCVSNRWNNIIGDPYFLKSYSAITRKHQLHGERLLAFFKLTHAHLYIRETILWYNNIELMKSQLLPSELGKFINSSNGLILRRSVSFDTYYVGNPITKKWVYLPPPKITDRTHYRISTGLVCEENTNELVPNYTVVLAGIPTGGHRDTMDIETYSSWTDRWSMPTLISTGNFYLHLDQPPLVCNGVVHWSGWSSIALYDLNGGENHLQLIKLPPPDDGKFYDFSFIRSEHDDVLWLGIHNYENMQFWMLPKSKEGSYRGSTTIPTNEWVLMHTITSASLLKEPAISLLQNNKIDNEILDSIRLEGFIPRNPIVVVLRQGERVFLHNLETKSMESLQYHGGQPTEWWYPYMESPYLSSYALKENQQLPPPFKKKPHSKNKNTFSWLVDLQNIRDATQLVIFVEWILNLTI